MDKLNVSFPSLGDTLAGVLFLPDCGQPCPALVVCHGALEFKENYFELCAYLAGRGIAALAVDMHGHGESQGRRYHVEMMEWTADVRAALDFLATQPRVDMNRVGAFGLSSGGTAILDAALIDPRLKTLVLLDATTRNTFGLLETAVFQALILAGRLKRLLTKHDLRISTLKMFAGTQAASDPDINRQVRADPRLIEAFSSFPLPGAAECFFVDTLKRVHRIGVPTLVLWGEDDQLDPPESARRLYAALTCKKQLHIIPGNGHLGHLDRNREQVFRLTAEWALENMQFGTRPLAAA
jgi:pimeloyl-ACP methyl ester carboxylesterase